MAIVLTSIAATGQPGSVHAQNKHLFDSLMKDYFPPFCGSSGIEQTATYPRRVTSDITKWLRRLNSVFAEGIGEADVQGILKGLGERQHTDTTEVGLMHEVVYTMYDHYLGVKLHFTFLDGRILARRFEIGPQTLRRCKDRSQSFPDMEYLARVYAPILDFPLRYNPWDCFFSERLSPDAIRRTAIAHPDYRFDLPGNSLSAAVNQMLAGQYFLTQWDHLHEEYPSSEFVDLVRAGDTHTLIGLLYSPNYFYAVSAMQSLVFLDTRGKIQLSPEISQQIGRVRNAHFQICFQRSDVLYTHDSYSEIKLKDDWFIRQFETALLKKPE
jgi:hypothetical protein